MSHKFRTGGLVVAIVMYGTVLTLQAGELNVQASDANPDQLVQRLGAKKFALREAAMNDLISLGLPAMESVNAGCESDDPEIRARCKVISSSIRLLNRERLIDRFLTMGTAETSDLPGWNDFKSIGGDTAASRNLYARMATRYWDFLEFVFDTKTRDIGLAVSSMATQLQDRVNASRTIPEEDLAAVLFAAGNPNAYLRNASTILSLCGRSESQTLILTSRNRETILKLIGGIVGRRLDDVSISNQLYLSVLYGIPQGLDLARRIIKDKTHREYVRQNAIILIAKLGSADDIKILSPLLNDTAHAIKIQDIQIRDLALVTMAHLAGEDPRDYGFENIRYESVWVFELYSLTVSSDEVRLRGINKWRENHRRVGQN